MYSVDMPNNSSPFTLFTVGIVFMDAYRRTTYLAYDCVCIQKINKSRVHFTFRI